MKSRSLLLGLVYLPLLVACRDSSSGNARALPTGSGAGEVAEPEVVTMIRQAEDAYADFLQKHEAARSATRARLALGDSTPEYEKQAYQAREDQALAARTQAAEAKMAMRRTVDAFQQGSDFERAQVAAYLRRSNLREEIRARALAAELFAGDESRRDDQLAAEQDMDAYRQRLAKEEAEWELTAPRRKQGVASAK